MHLRVYQYYKKEKTLGERHRHNCLALSVRQKERQMGSNRLLFSGSKHANTQVISMPYTAVDDVCARQSIKREKNTLKCHV